MRSHIIDFLSPWLGEEAAAMLAPTWFTFAALACIVASALVIRDARRSGDDVPAVITALITAYVAAVSCGILIPLLYDIGRQLASGGGLRIRWPGMVSYCGFIGAFAAVYVVCRRMRGRLSFARFGDLLAAPACIAVVFARLGCFVAGCDYGKVTSLPWAIRFPSGSPAWSDHVRSGLVPPGRDASLPVHPTQLYEVLLGVLLFVGVRWLARQPWAQRRAGRVFLGAVAGYAIGRWFIEVFRGDAGRGFLGPVSSAQVFSFALLAFALVVLLRSRRATVAALSGALLFCWLAIPTPARAEDRGIDYEVGLLYGASVSLNRRGQQVPQLGGAALSGSVDLPRGFALGLDLSSMVNSVATHDAVLLAGSYRRPITRNLDVGARVGMGFVWVDFDDRAFDDVRAAGIRGGLSIDYYLGQHFIVMLRPLGIDFTSADEIGGPILSYQLYLGFGYRSRSKRSRLQAAAPKPPKPWPGAPPAPAPPGRAAPPGQPAPPPEEPAPPPEKPAPPPEPIDPYAGEKPPPTGPPPEPIDPYAEPKPKPESP